MHDGDWRHHDSVPPHLPDPSERRARIAALLMELRRQGIEDERVLATIAAVPRERFVPASLHEEAWDNTALPIGSGQTISQPYVVALMTSALGLSGDQRVLEIGTGSGYQTAILAALAREVRSIERHAVLAADAAAILVDLGYENIEIGVGDGTSGWPEAAPYDRIIVTAAAPRVPPALMDQLSEHGGRLVIPVGDHDQDQHLFAIERHGEDLRQRTLGPVRFVPLIGRAGFAPVRERGHHA